MLANEARLELGQLIGGIGAPAIVDLGKSTAEGAAIVDGHIAAWPAGPWSQMTFGYDHYQGLKIDVDLWFDDLAFGAEEIPCAVSPGSSGM
jgi:hypothetical protein